MVEVPDDVMELARAAARVVRTEVDPGARILLFGSWAKGTALPRSDVDLAVGSSAPIRPAALARAAQAIEKLRTLRTIDVVDLATAGESLRDEILSIGIEL